VAIFMAWDAKSDWQSLVKVKAENENSRAFIQVILGDIDIAT
jgi:hypothetical protein